MSQIDFSHLSSTILPILPKRKIIQNRGGPNNTKLYKTRRADSSVYSPPVCVSTHFIPAYSCGPDSGFPQQPPARFLSFPSFPGSACPRGGENRSAAWVDLSGAVAIKNSPVSGAWIADGTTTTTTIPARMVRSLPGSRAIGLTPAKGAGEGAIRDAVAFPLREMRRKGTNEFAILCEKWKRRVFIIM